MKIHDKNYNNHDLVIPNSIWNDKSINGVQKIILTLIKKFTSNGSRSCEALTRQMAQMIHTHEPDIKYNLQKLHEKGHIEIYKDDASRTQHSIVYKYTDQDNNSPEVSGTSGLF